MARAPYLVVDATGGALLRQAEADAACIAALHTAAPVLLEIAKAALALAGPSKPSDAHIPEWNALLAALAKVRS